MCRSACHSIGGWFSLASQTPVFHGNRLLVLGIVLLLVIVIVIVIVIDLGVASRPRPNATRGRRLYREVPFRPEGPIGVGNQRLYSNDKDQLLPRAIEQRAIVPVRLLIVPRHVKPPEFDYDYEHRFAEHEHEDCS